MVTSGDRDTAVQSARGNGRAGREPAWLGTVSAKADGWCWFGGGPNAWCVVVRVGRNGRAVVLVGGVCRKGMVAADRPGGGWAGAVPAVAGYARVMRWCLGGF
jgi:hypothetical protein